MKTEGWSRWTWLDPAWQFRCLIFTCQMGLWILQEILYPTHDMTIWRCLISRQINDLYNLVLPILHQNLQTSRHRPFSTPAEIFLLSGGMNLILSTHKTILHSLVPPLSYEPSIGRPNGNLAGIYSSIVFIIKKSNVQWQESHEVLLEIMANWLVYLFLSFCTDSCNGLQSIKIHILTKSCLGHIDKIEKKIGFSSQVKL